MAGPETWTVKGVSRETREAVREAAASRNLTIGAWLDRALRRAAREALKPAPPPATRREIAQVIEQTLDEQLAPLAEKLERLERKLALLEAPPAETLEAPPAETDDGDPVGVVLQRMRRRRLGG
ncbi:MAG TPA: hypothetical protein VFG47_11260 [Geminicoccaceae bacterium]|nr:hypothetical protein [Geminicoccaceae bacterium]